MGLLARAYHVQDGKDYANDGLRMNGVCKEVEREVPDCGGWGVGSPNHVVSSSIHPNQGHGQNTRDSFRHWGPPA